MRSSRPLYDLLAPTYEEHFAVPHRRAYDDLAWELCSAALPPPPGVVVDVGCGIGRWAGRLLDRGYPVVGIEPAPRMAERAADRLSGRLGGALTLRRERVEDVDLAPGSVAAVLAMGSLQYTQDPALQLKRVAAWLRPGGTVCVLTDSLHALVLELLAGGRTAEAMTRLDTRRGVWQVGGFEADLHLFDAAGLGAAFADAGLDVVAVSGLLVGSSAFGRAELTRRLTADGRGALDLERTLADRPELADLGKQLLMIGRRRPDPGGTGGPAC